MTSLPLYWPADAALADIAAGTAPPPWQRRAIEADYRLVPLDTLSPIPALSPDAPDTDPLAGLGLLAVIQPRGLSPADNVALDDWVRRGGRLLMALDPALTGDYEAPLGDPRRPAWKWSEKPGEPPVSRKHLLTHDDDRYEDELWWRSQRPELVMGPGSWGWVERGFASMRALAAPGVLEAMTVPTLILAATNDQLVSWPAIAAAAARLPNVELVRFGPESHHEILRETDAVRDRAMDAIDAFLARVLDRA